MLRRWWQYIYEWLNKPWTSYTKLKNSNTSNTFQFATVLTRRFVVYTHLYMYKYIYNMYKYYTYTSKARLSIYGSNRHYSTNVLLWPPLTPCCNILFLLLNIFLWYDCVQSFCCHVQLVYCCARVLCEMYGYLEILIIAVGLVMLAILLLHL